MTVGQLLLFLEACLCLRTTRLGHRGMLEGKKNPNPSWSSDQLWVDCWPTGICTLVLQLIQADWFSVCSWVWNVYVQLTAKQFCSDRCNELIPKELPLEKQWIHQWLTSCLFPKDIPENPQKQCKDASQNAARMGNLWKLLSLFPIFCTLHKATGAMVSFLSFLCLLPSLYPTSFMKVIRKFLWRT